MNGRKRVVLLMVAALLLPLSLSAGDKEKQYARLDVVVVKGYNGKPVRNASVVLHMVNDEGKQERGGVQLKTDAEGRTQYEGIPYGKLRVQVIMRGFQTFGEDYDIAEPRKEVVIKLRRPQDQYSIYDDKKDESGKSEKKDEQPQ